MTKKTRRQALINRRERLGITREALGEAVGCSADTIYGWETGRTRPRAKYRPALAKALQFTRMELDDILDPAGESAVTAHRVPDWLGHYESLFQGTGQVDGVEFVSIPGLLQTPDYARAAELTSGVPLSDDDLDRATNLRQARQQILFRHPNPLRYTVLLFEGVLRDPVGGHEVMAAQLEHLLYLARLPNIEIRLIGPGIAPCAISSFELFTRSGGHKPFLVTTVNIFGPYYLENPKAVNDFVAIHDRLLETALSPDDTVDRIRYILETDHQ